MDNLDNYIIDEPDDYNFLDQRLSIYRNPINSFTNLGDPQLEVQDPNPNVWEMFCDFDQRFFNGLLVRNGVQLEWSSKMTSCAGLCRFDPRDLSCGIKLSKPLLELRTRKDLVETLIHEMIHALLFVKRDSDNRESHGPKFHENMHRINREAKLNISVYHSFHDEVRHFQNHVWRCNGACANRHPFYGWVRRATNRKPGPYDTWWNQHQLTCGGEFIKVSEPEGYKSKTKGKKDDYRIQNKIRDIRSFFTPTKSEPVSEDLNDIKPFNGTGQVLGGNTENATGRSNLLDKFDKISNNNSDKLISISPDKISHNNSDKLISISSINHFHFNDSNDHKPNQPELVVINDSDDECDNKSATNPIRKLPTSTTVNLVSPIKPNANKVNETILLDDDDDEDDFSFLNNISDQELLMSCSSNSHSLRID